MANMTDDIEQFLKQLVRQSGSAELQRATLALQFGCAPSQINYVLATRFTPERGYLVESRRGGGGYIRITRLNLQVGDALHEMVHQQIGHRVSQDDAIGYIGRLVEQELINDREAAIMQAAMRRETISLELPFRDIVRANILKAMITAVLRF
jgi:transcriptional regulator CtsR